MKLSPLQLLHSQYAGISLIARDVELPEVSEDASPYPPIDGEQIHTDISLGTPPQENPKQFVIKLGVDNLKVEQNNFPYIFAVKIEGMFRIDHDGDLEERRRMVVINGTAMLYGLVREQLLLLSSRHKHGPMQLPSLDFRALKVEEQPSIQADQEPNEKLVAKKGRPRNKKD